MWPILLVGIPVHDSVTSSNCFRAGLNIDGFRKLPVNVTLSISICSGIDLKVSTESFNTRTCTVCHVAFNPRSPATSSFINDSFEASSNIALTFTFFPLPFTQTGTVLRENVSGFTLDSHGKVCQTICPLPWGIWFLIRKNRTRLPVMICIMQQAMVSELASTNTILTTAITVLSTVLKGQTTEAKAFFFRDLPTVPDIDLLKLLAIPYSMVILSTENGFFVRPSDSLIRLWE